VVARKFFVESVVVGSATIVGWLWLIKNNTKIPVAVAELAYKNNSKVVIVDLGIKKLAYMTHPDSIQVMCKGDGSTLSKATLIAPKGSINESLILKCVGFVNGDVWRHQRTILSPAFHFDFLKLLVPAFVSETSIMFDQWDKCDVSDLPIKSWMTKLAADILGRTAFGTSFNMLTGQLSEFNVAHERSWEHETGFFRYLNAKLYDSLPLRSNFQFKKDVATLLRVLDGIITKQVQNKKNGSKNEPNLLNILLDDKNGLTLEEIRSNTYIFYLAGHETTASALTSTLYLLAKHQNIQKKNTR